MIGTIRAALVGAVLLAGCSAVPAGPTAEPSPIDVPPDSFYQPPPIGSNASPGDVLRLQPITAPDGVRAWAILYVSTGMDGGLHAISGLLATPASAAPAGGRPVVAYAHGTTGLADACAPSQSGAGNGELAAIAAPFLAAGDAVVFTDYEGLGTPGPHPYIVGASEGHAVLDSIRAARGVIDLSAGTEAGIVGHSEGGHAALWAGQLATTYAPELDVRGVVAAAPAGDLVAIAAWLVGPDSGQPAWMNAAIFTSAWHVVYGLPLDGVVKPEDVPLTDALQNSCPGDVNPPDSTPLLVDPATVSAWRQRLDENSPGATRTTAPILLLQGTADEQIPFESTNSEVSRLCSAGDSIDYRVIQGGKHDDSLFTQPQLDTAVTWMADRLTGAKAASTCP